MRTPAATASCRDWWALAAPPLWGCCSIIFATPLSTIFSSDPAVIEQAANMLRIVAISEPLFGVSIVLSGALRGLGDTRFPLAISLVGHVGGALHSGPDSGIRSENRSGRFVDRDGLRPVASAASCARCASNASPRNIWRSISDKFSLFKKGTVHTERFLFFCFYQTPSFSRINAISCAVGLQLRSSWRIQSGT